MKEMQVNFLETHYLFNDDSHTIDAFVRNQCEKELLAIIYHTFSELNLTDKIKLEATPPKEGSFKEIIQFLSENRDIATLIFAGLAIIATLLSRHSETKLDKELKRLEIKRLQKELGEYKDLDATKSQEFFHKFIDLFYENLISNPKIARHISNFYQHLMGYEKVQSVEYTPYNQNHKAIIEPQVVHREDFHRFILQTSEDEIIDENAKIYIHSPMLVKGRKSWRGHYMFENQVIDFSMNDRDFKNDVYNGTIKFKNGSFIYAVLQKTIKYDDFGNIKSQKYTVEVVTKVSSDDGYEYETRQGKKHKDFKEALNKQMSLGLDNEL